MQMITKLNANEVFVFGSNYDGIHGAGAAKFARAWGAKMGQASGRMGQTYAIITKDLRTGEFVGWEKVREQFDVFIDHVNSNRSNKFLLTPIGTGLAGAKLEDLNDFLNDYEIPENLIKLW